MDELTVPLAWTPWLRIAGVLVIGLVAWLLLGWAMHAFRRALVEHSEDDEDDKRIETVMRVARDLLGILVGAVVLMLSFAELGFSIAPLLGTAGIAGVTFALAAQGIARDFLAGVSLLMDNKLRVGDDVEIAGKSGVVESVNLRTIRLRDRDGVVHFVRTGDVGTVSNKSLGPG